MSDFSLLTKSIVKNMSDKNNEKIETAASQIITQVKETVVREVIHDTLNVDLSGLATKDEVAQSRYDDTAIQEALENKVNIDTFTTISSEINDKFNTQDATLTTLNERIVSLENKPDYDDTNIKESLALKADKSEIPDITPFMTSDDIIALVNDNKYDDAALQAALLEKANSNDVYTLSQVNNLLENKMDVALLSDLATKQEVADAIYDDTSIQEAINDRYTKEELDVLLNAKADNTGVYTITQINALLNDKANTNDIPDVSKFITGQDATEIVKANKYDDTEIKTTLSEKANATDVYTKQETYSAVELTNLLNTKANVSDIPDISDLATKQEVSDSVYDDTSIQNALSNKADKNDVYTKQETYSATELTVLLATKANVNDIPDISNLATKQEVNDSIYDDTAIQEALNDRYTKEEVISLLEAKANLEDVYKKVDTYSAEKIQELLDLEANKDSVYTISQVDNLLSTKANVSAIPDISNLATKQEVVDSIYDDTNIQNTLANKADKDSVYTTTQVDELLNTKANVSDIPDISDLATKQEVNDSIYDDTAIKNNIASKANSNDVYTKIAIDELLNAKVNVSALNDLATKQEVADSIYDDTAIQEALTTKANKDSVYTISQVNDLLDIKANVSDIPDISNLATKQEVNDSIYDDTTIQNTLANKADKDLVYTKEETSSLLEVKADNANVYTITQTNDLLDSKIDKNAVYTTSQVDELLNTKANSNDIPDISNLATKQEVSDAIYDDIAIQEALSNRYTKEEVVSLLEAKANLEDVYKKVDTYSAEKIQELLDLEANKDSVYTISQVDNLLSTKANVSDIPDISNLATKQEVVDSIYDDTAIQEALANKADKSALETLATKEELSNKIEPDALNDYVAKSTLFTNNGSGVFNAGWEAADGSSHYFTAEADSFGGIFSYNAVNNVSSFVGLNKSPADFSDVDFQLYAKDKTSNIGVRLNGSATKGLFYLKNSTNLGFPATREIATLEDIPDVSQFITYNDIVNKADKSEIPDVSTLASKQEVNDYVATIQTEVAKKINQAQLFKNNVFSYTQSDDDGSYNTFFAEKNSGGGNQYFNALTNTLSYLGVNKPSTIGSDVDVQLYSKDKNTNIGTRLNMSATKGMYYLKNSGNLGFPAGREIAVLDDIPDISGKADSDDVYTRAEIDNKLSDKIDVSKVWNGSGNYFQTKYTHNDGSYAQLWNEADGGGSQYLHAPADIISYVGTNDDGNTTDANNDVSAICVQLYSKYKEGTKPNGIKNYGTRLNVNPQKIYYTKGTNTSANGGSEDNELAVIGDVKALLARIEELEAKVAALENA